MNPLPDYRASLSKYYRARDHYPLIASIGNDTPESVVRSRFDENLYATGKQRYLTVIGDTVIRDSLVDFVHDEGDFTERVKMVMYFLFMFRDPRYREFICQVVGKDGGKWDTSVFRQRHSDYFEGAGGHKAFTNLRQFLFQTDILDEGSLNVHMPDLATWFPPAVRIAASSISDSKARKSFLSNPHGFLIRYKVNALLNATAEELAHLDLSSTIQEVDQQSGIDLSNENEQVDSLGEFRVWDRVPPKARSQKPIQMEADPASFERANSQHYLLEERICGLCKQQGFTPRTNKHIDVLVDSGDMCIVFEMKSCSLEGIWHQLRRAISQLLEYRYLYRKQLPAKTELCVVLERKPRGRLMWLSEYVESLGIGLIWKNDQDDRLNCTERTKNLIGQSLPWLKNENF